jgi:hypothetical protein
MMAVPPTQGQIAVAQTLPALMQVAAILAETLNSDYQKPE